MTANYPPPVNKLLTLGDPRGEREWPDYLALGISAEHVPDLIRMALDETLHWADSESKEVWSPIHAWRTLGQLRAEAATEPLTHLLVRIDRDHDDWVGEELPEVFGMIGANAIPVLVAYLSDPRHDLWARVAAGSGLEEIGKQYPPLRSECVTALTHQLERFAENDPTLNGSLLANLLDLRGVESAPVIERAFAAKKVDGSVAGDWEDVQIEFGLKTERTTPRAPIELDEAFNRFAEIVDTLASRQGGQSRRIETSNDADEIVDRVISRMLARGELKSSPKPQRSKSKKKK